jgi:signal transduction histidine kinase
MNEPADPPETAPSRRARDRVRPWSLLVLRLSGSALGTEAEGPPPWTWAWIARRALGFGIVLGLALTVVWAITPVHYYWPGWIWFALALPVAFDRSIRRALRSHVRRALAVHAAISLVISAALVAIWLLSSHRYFWPIWPILVLAVVLASHALLVPSASSNREQALAQRVDVLTRTRRDALDVQVAEMRRVERDLHDGAQARLVSLGMTLGMAEELLGSDPAEARRLLAEARTAAGDALGDLRALVRGILPPVLADRGLAGAAQALVLSSPIPVETKMELPSERLPAPVESAAYFAIAEALTNAIKHSGARSAWVQMIQANAMLSMVVGDDGRGGADPNRGSGLRGIEHRLEAFDGTMHISSPSGGPTVVTMEVPCELSSPKISPS